MIKAVIASGVIHFICLCLAVNGVEATAGFIGGVFALSWEALLALFLAIFAFIIWLIFGLSTVALMGPGVAVALVVAALAALNIVEQVPAKVIAEGKKDKPVPVEMAMLATPNPLSVGQKSVSAAAKKTDGKDKDQAATSPPEKLVAPTPMFSPSFAKAVEEGMKNKGASVKGKLWTVNLPGNIVSAAEKTPEDSLSRQPTHKVDKGEDKSTPEAITLKADNTRRDSGGARPSEGVTRVFERMAESMPRLAAIRTGMLKVRQNHVAQIPVSETPAQMLVSKKSAQTRANEKIRKRVRARAEEGYGHAQFALAEEILIDSSRRSDVAEARELLERAALGGYVPAQVLLAMIAAEGRNGPSPDPADLAQAHMWLSEAAEGGNQAAAQARDELAREFHDGDAVRAKINRHKLKKLMALVAPATGSAGERVKLNEQLRHAAVLGDTESVHVLLARNADADNADEEGRTPLIEAAWRGYHGIVKALINAGARLDAKDATGKDAMAWAAINGHTEIVTALIAVGTPMDVPDQDGFTPLMRAAWNGHVAVVARLLRAGARADLRNRFNRSARDYARKQRNPLVLKVLAGS